VAAPSPGAPVGVLLSNLGAPDTLDHVEPFLVRLFSDRQIIELRGGPWLQPLLARTDEAIADIETLCAVDMLFADQARASGITTYRRAEALNTHPLFVDALAGLVTRDLQAHR
jgi:protoheme ferro-lyase